MAYNLKKAQKINNSVLPLSSALQEYNDNYDFTLDNNKQVNNFNAYLEKDRRENKNGPQTHEAMLDDVRKNAKKAEKITEGGLSDSDSKLYPHRQFEDGSDKYSMMPINMLSEAYDQKWRDAFKKVNKKAETTFWDKYIGDQLDEKQRKVLVNVPQSGSQLNNNPERFKNLDGMPSDPDAEKNRKNFGKDIKIEPQVSFAGIADKRQIVAALKEADSLLFGTYVKANIEKRQLSLEEQALIDTINDDKQKMLTILAQAEELEEDLPGFDAPPTAESLAEKKKKPNNNNDEKVSF